VQEVVRASFFRSNSFFFRSFFVCVSFFSFFHKKKTFSSSWNMWPRPKVPPLTKWSRPSQKKINWIHAGRVETKDQNENTNVSTESEGKKVVMCRKVIFRSDKSIFVLFRFLPIFLLSLSGCFLKFGFWFLFTFLSLTKCVSLIFFWYRQICCNWK